MDRLIPGGLEKVAAPRKAGQDSCAQLSADQQVALVAEAATGRLRTAAEAVGWVAEWFGAPYTISGMSQLLRRLRCKPKVPRLLAEHALLAEQEEWKKGGVPSPCETLA